MQGQSRNGSKKQSAHSKGYLWAFSSTGPCPATSMHLRWNWLKSRSGLWDRITCSGDTCGDSRGEPRLPGGGRQGRAGAPRGSPHLQPQRLGQLPGLGGPQAVAGVGEEDDGHPQPPAGARQPAESLPRGGQHLAAPHQHAVDVEEEAEGRRRLQGERRSPRSAPGRHFPSPSGRPPSPARAPPPPPPPLLTRPPALHPRPGGAAARSAPRPARRQPRSAMPGPASCCLAPHGSARLGSGQGTPGLVVPGLQLPAGAGLGGGAGGGGLARLAEPLPCRRSVFSTETRVSWAPAYRLYNVLKPPACSWLCWCVPAAPSFFQQCLLAFWIGLRSPDSYNFKHQLHKVQNYLFPSP